MKIEKTPREDHQVTLTVEIEQDKMEGAKKRSARQLAKRGKIAGFRPGKAPYNVILQQYGEQAVIEGAIDILLEEIYPKALEEAEIEPGAQGNLEEMESLDPPKFVFTIPLRPEIDLGDYRKLRLAYKYKKPGDAEVEAKLEELQRMYATMTSVDRPIDDGDYVLADVVGKKVGAEEGEDPVVFEKERHAVHIQEKKSDNEEPFVGFGKKLLGMSEGDSKTISKKFPKTYKDESLREVSVKYKVTIGSVQGTEFPELDDEFAKTLGAGETMAELRGALEKSLEAESVTEYDDEYFSELIDKIKEDATIKYPPQALDREVEMVVADMSQRLSQQGMEFEAYLKMQNTTLEKFTEEEARPAAVKRLERGMIFDELAQLEKIEIKQDELESEFNQTMMNLTSQGYDFNKVKGGARAQKEIANNIAQQSATQLITRQTLDRMKDIATGDFAKAEKAAAKAAKEAEKAEKAKAEEVVEEPVVEKEAEVTETSEDKKEEN